MTKRVKMRTQWGYEVETLPQMLTVSDFNQMTGNKYAGDARLSAAIDAANSAVRNWCGWHISPNIECTFKCSPYDRIIGTRSRFIDLPSSLVTEIESVTEDGQELTDGQFEAWEDGLLKRACFRNWGDRVEVVFKSGYSELDAAFAQSIANVCETVLQALPLGVTQETAGNVSVSWNSDATGVAQLAVSRMAGAFSNYKPVTAHAV